jgi:hypothetical protein
VKRAGFNVPSRIFAFFALERRKYQLPIFSTAFGFPPGRFGWTALPETAAAFGRRTVREDAGEAGQDRSMIDARQLCNLYHRKSRVIPAQRVQKNVHRS